MNYTVSRPTFDTFAQVLGKERAEAFISEFEHTVNEQRSALDTQLAHNQAQLKAVVKEELRNELITREVFDARFKSMEQVMDERFKAIEKVMDERFKTVDARFKQQDFKLNVLIALAFVALTFANPTFIELVKHALK